MDHGGFLNDLRKAKINLGELIHDPPEVIHDHRDTVNDRYRVVKCWCHAF